MKFPGQFLKRLGLVLDNKITFKKHVKDELNKAYFGVGKIKILRDILPPGSLVTIFKSLYRPHLDYGDVIYDQPNNSFTNKIEKLQYKTYLAITGAIQGTSRESLYKELGLESLSNRRWCRKLCAFSLGTFSMLYHLVKAFITHARNRYFFQLQN